MRQKEGFNLHDVGVVPLHCIWTASEVFAAQHHTVQIDSSSYELQEESDVMNGLIVGT